jgi:rod shape-determining protein MreD
MREWADRLRRVAPLGAVLLTGLALDVAVAPHLAVRGAAADVVLVALVAVSVRRGSRTGAGFGFAAGLGADVFLATPLGTSALAYTLVGHVLGRSSRPRTSGSAAALCSPASTCFACRTGRRHDPVRRRAAARRAALRRTVVLTAVGVGAGRLGTAVVATTLGGVAFPGAPGLLHIAGVVAISAPLGPLFGAGVRRLERGGQK